MYEAAVTDSGDALCLFIAVCQTVLKSVGQLLTLLHAISIWLVTCAATTGTTKTPNVSNAMTPNSARFLFVLIERHPQSLIIPVSGTQLQEVIQGIVIGNLAQSG